VGYFIAYRHTGENPDRLEQLLPLVNNSLQAKGIETYCTYFDENSFRAGNYTPQAIMDHAFKKIDEMGGLFVIQDSLEKSEGMLMEVGYCIAKGLPIVVAKRKAVNSTYLPDMADTSIVYDDTKDLVATIAVQTNLA